MPHVRPRRRLFQGISWALVAGQLLLVVPVAARSERSGPREGASTGSPAPAAPRVRVNRTVPPVEAPPIEPRFSVAPSVAEIVHARVFAEPLVPVGGTPGPEENRALASALLAFHRGGGVGPDATPGRFLADYPASPWRASLLANVAVTHAREHVFTRALEELDEAWQLTRDRTEPRDRAVADYALVEWLELAASFGMIDRVEARLAAVASRDVSGAAGARLVRVRESAGLIRRYPERTRWCGPEALLALLEARTPGAARPAALAEPASSSVGMTLIELERLARRAGLDVRMAQRRGSAAVPVPSIAHLKIGHYVTITDRREGAYFVVDRVRAASYWMDEATLASEGSGLFLVPARTDRTDWPGVSVATARATRGSGPLCPDGAPPPAPPPPPCPGGGAPPGGCGGPNCGLAGYRFQSVTASLLIDDTPAGYAPVRGPSVPLSVGYHQRSYTDQQIASMANMGPKWSFGWLRFVQEESWGPQVWVSFPPGGREVYAYANAEGVYPPHWSSRAVLVRTSLTPLRYERRLPDGTVEVYGQVDGAPIGQRRVFLTALIDPLGQAVQLTWDAQSRLVAITDALGQVTLLAYADADPLKITSVTDPFGRTATFTYNAAGQLDSITDVIGLTSRFAYGASDFVQAMTTPYGTTTFRHEPNPMNDINFRIIEATDPLGGTEHLEFEYQTPALAATAPSTEVPAGFGPWNANLNRYNTFYWDKRAWALFPGDLTKAAVTHWMVGEEWPQWQKYSYVPHSIKRPLEGRTWYAYPGQTAGLEDTLQGFVGPSRVGRVLDDGTSQVSATTYNNLGLALTTTDPIGRQTSYDYAANGRDLVAVRQTTGSLNDLLGTYSDYTDLGEPQTTADAAGQVTTLSYNGIGQVLTVTNARNETTTSTYDLLGRLSAVLGPVSGATTAFTYDALNRVRTTTDADGYTVTTDYDGLDRPIRATYPDGTYEATTYDKLDLASRRDRAGRITRYYYDATRRLTATRDPAGRVIRQEWCTCGALDALVDANGHRTRWERDLQGRVTLERRADAVTTTSFTYGSSSGRLLTVTDPIGQVTTAVYGADGGVVSVSYTNEVVATADILYSYDPMYRRVSTMTDGTGLTTFGYHQAGQLGARQIATVNGPLTDDTVTYAYDELGRLTNRAINGVGLTWAFDALGRVTSEVNVLGTFGYTYDGATGRLATVAFPNGQTSDYAYYPNGQDRRLQTIHHKYPAGATLSRFDYAYDVTGNILTWRQQADSLAVEWQYGYDSVDQLVAAVKHSTDPSPTILKRYAYAYDPAGNRTAEQIDDQIAAATYDSLNRLVNQSAVGPLVVSGTVNEPASVIVQGRPASVSSDSRFSGTVPLGTGTNTVTITAIDTSGNQSTKQYEVDSLGTERQLTYDANSNLLSDGSRTFEWNARNELVAATAGSQRAEFVYGGSANRTGMVLKEGGATTQTRNFIWCGGQLCEERDATGSGVKARFVDQGTQMVGAGPGGTARFYTFDHLGSVRGMTDSEGQSQVRYEYDPYGRKTRTGGTEDSVFGFGGAFALDSSGVELTRYRAYAPELGRWLSEDPLRLLAGDNLGRFVENDPVNRTDPDGLYSCSFVSSRVLATVPVPPYNKKHNVEDWQLQTPEYEDSHEQPFVPWGVLWCVWSRKYTRSQKYVKMIVDRYQCADCKSSWSRWVYREEQLTRELTDIETRKTQVMMPIALDSWVDPMSACYRFGRPSR